MSLSGSIEDLPLLEILQVVSFCQKTGHLTVRAPEGEAGVLFREGRVVAGYMWDAAGRSHAGESARSRIASILERLVRLREGEFAFNLSDGSLERLSGHDLELVRLDEGINPEELMLDLARRLDEDRRDCAATLEASFSSPASDELALEELPAIEAFDDVRPLPPPVSPAPAPAEPSPGGPTLLLVDDEADVCRVVGGRLTDSGFEVRVAATTAQARRQMLRFAAERRRFLLAVDLGLPAESGSSFRGGLDVARQASALDPAPPVLLMAEAFDEKLRGRARRLGVSLLAFKPGLSKLDPLQYEADLRAFADKLANDLLPRLAGRRRAPCSAVPAPLVPPPEQAARVAALRSALGEIEANPDPDLVAFLLLRAARSFFGRVLLFVAKDDRLRGLAGFGPVEGGASLDLLARGLSVSLHEPSPFSDAVAAGRAWSGPVSATGPMRELLNRIGPLGTDQAAVVPVRVSRETIAVLYGDAPQGAALPDLEPFVAFVARAGQALEEALSARRATRVVA